MDTEDALLGGSSLPDPVSSALSSARTIAKRGLHTFDPVWDIGYRQITNNTRPMQSRDDLKGLKIRVPPGALWISLFQGFGANPTTVSFAELYSALQTRVADGEENPLSIITTAKLYEVQKYCSITNHMWDGLCPKRHDHRKCNAKLQSDNHEIG